jgi:hypothetical protein
VVRTVEDQDPRCRITKALNAELEETGDLGRIGDRGKTGDLRKTGDLERTGDPGKIEGGLESIERVILMHKNQTHSGFLEVRYHDGK